MSGGALSQQSIGLSGSGGSATGHPIISPSTIDFGNVALNSQPQSESALLTNDCTQPLTVTGAVLPQAPFAATTLPAAGTVVAPGGSVGIPVVFTPDIVGNSLSSPRHRDERRQRHAQPHRWDRLPTEPRGRAPDPRLRFCASRGDRDTDVHDHQHGIDRGCGDPSKPPVTSAGFAAVSSLPRRHHLFAAGASVTETVSFAPPSHRAGDRRVDPRFH